MPKNHDYIRWKEKQTPEALYEQAVLWIEKRRLFGLLVQMRREFPAEYYKVKHEMLMEDSRTFASVFRGVERTVKYAINP